MENYFTYLRQLNMESMMLRIVLAMLMGGIIGLDREMKRRPAGFRTYLLVAMGASMTMILSQYLNLMLSGPWFDPLNDFGDHTDQVRLGAQVINGIGFIGAGTILVTPRNEVKGLTTASGLWASACMGLAIGAGFYECMVIGFLLILTSMKLLPFIENAVMARAKNMNIYIEMDSIENLGDVVNHMKAEGFKLYDVEISKDQYGNSAKVNGMFYVCMPERRQHTEVLAKLSTLDGIIVIEEV